MRFPRRFTALLVVAAGLTAPASASAAVELEQLGSFDRPTYVIGSPDHPNRLFVVEQEGRIQLITEGGSTTTFLDIRSLVHNPDFQGSPLGDDYGLYSMSFSPFWRQNHLFYVAYSGLDHPDTAEDESGDLHIDEFHAKRSDLGDPASRRPVLTIEYPGTPQVHHGAQLQRGPTGYLLISTGDGGVSGDAQDITNLRGKLLQIDLGDGGFTAPGEYAIPGNPFGDPKGCTDGCDEIWSYGLQNPWRFSFERVEFDALHRHLIIGDVGSRWEEVNSIAQATLDTPGGGLNFGWDCREGAHPGPGQSSPVCVERAGTFTEPSFEYQHADPGPCSIVGGYVVRDRAVPELYRRYLYADFCTGELRSVSLNPDLNAGLSNASGDRSEGLFVPRVTSFGEDVACPDEECRIYVASLDGPVYRLTEAGNEATVTILSLDLGAKKQPLRKKLTFFATASADSTLVARGKAIKRKAKELAANQKTKVKVKLKRAKRKQIQKKLEKKGKAKVKILAIATDQTGSTARDTTKVKLRD